MERNFERIVIVTKKTQLEDLIDRFNTEQQARFYLEHAGQDFEPIRTAHDEYHDAVRRVTDALPEWMERHVIDRVFVPQYMFGANDIVTAIGPDGLVVNTAKYLAGQPLFGVNPSPALFDGILLPFTPGSFAGGLQGLLDGGENIAPVTLAEALFASGRRLLAFNDFFIGARTHVSARYEIKQGDRHEAQSSCGIIVSTGAGSTGWMKSVHAGAQAIAGSKAEPVRLPWEARELIFAVREPFPSKTTGASLVYGRIGRGEPSLVVHSQMAQNGVVFSDGMEADFIPFNAGETVTIRIAQQQARLVLN